MIDIYHNETKRRNIVARKTFTTRRKYVTPMYVE